MTTPPPEPDDPLTSAFRTVRRLSALDAPYGGVLARDGGDAVVLVDVDTCPLSRSETDLGPHVLGVRDVARTRTGCALVLPWCVESLDRLLLRRGPASLGAGEAVTVALSLHRGRAALAAAGRGVPARGAWWVTDAGCPVFARSDQPEAPTIDEATARVWERLIETTGSRAVADLLRVLDVEDPAAERALFTAASPTPLVLDAAMPVRAERLARADRADEAESPPADGGRLLGALRAALVRHVDADLADTVSDAAHALRRRVGRATTGRRLRPVVLAGIVAGVALTAGLLLWPTPEDAVADREPRSAAVAASEAASPAPVSTPTTAAVDGAAATPAPDEAEDPAAAAPATALEAALSAGAGCAEESRCRDHVEDGAGDGVVAAFARLVREDQSVELLDDLGGVAVLRATGAAGGTVVVVVVEVESRWLVRDIREIAAP